MDLELQKELVQLIERYNNINPEIIKKNIVKCIDRSQYYRKSALLAEAMGLDLQTVYLWRQPQKTTSVSFEHALKLATILEIPVEWLMDSNLILEQEEEKNNND